MDIRDFGRLFQWEPRLLKLLHDAVRTKPSRQECMEDLWYRKFRPQVRNLVGWYAGSQHFPKKPPVPPGAKPGEPCVVAESFYREYAEERSRWLAEFHKNRGTPPELRSAEAYDMVTQTVYYALADCICPQCTAKVDRMGDCTCGDCTGESTCDEDDDYVV
jgi:hypothetical protein